MFAVKDVNAMSSHSDSYGICIDVASCCSAGQFPRLSPTFSPSLHSTFELCLEA